MTAGSLSQAVPSNIPPSNHRTWDPTVLFQYGTGLLTLVLVLAPIIPVVYQSFLAHALYDPVRELTLGNFPALLQSAGFTGILWNTVVFAALTTIIAQVLGTGAAIVFVRTDMPGARIFGELFLWPLFVSALILSFGWYSLYGPSGYVTLMVQGAIGGVPWNLYSLTGMAAIAGVSQAPVAFIYCSSSATTTDPALEEAARIAGAGTFTTLRRITLPLMLPAVAYSSVLNFTVGMELLAIPLLFGEPVGISVLTTFLYNNGVNSAKPDHGLVASAALLLLLAICFLVWLQTRMLGNTRRFVTLGGKAARPRPFRLGKLRWPFAIIAALYAAVAILGPIGALTLRAFTSLLSPMVPVLDVLTLDNFAKLFEYPIYMRSIWNSFVVSSVGGAIATALVAMVILVSLRSEFRWRRQLQYLSLFPRAVPGVIAGLGFFYAFALVPGMGEIRNTIWILVIAFAMRYLPVGIGAVAPMIMQISPDLDRAARTQGATWWTASHRILLPIMRPSLVACFTILFTTFFKEYSTAIFLFAPGSEVIGTSLIQLWAQGEMGVVAALAVMQVVVIAVTLGIARAVFRVKIYG
jgi:iron(III) transport system permease protein